MITFFLIMILSYQPGITFGIIEHYETLEECKVELKKAPPEFRQKLACLPVAAPGTFDI